MVIAIFAAIVSFFRSSACQAQKNLFWVLIIVIFLAIYDTYLTVEGLVSLIQLQRCLVYICL